MELTQQVRDYASKQGLEEADALQAGMQEKSDEFRKKREIYVSADRR
jgi:phosphomethylpyrimidine synthase